MTFTRIILVLISLIVSGSLIYLYTDNKANGNDIFKKYSIKITIASIILIICELLLFINSIYAFLMMVVFDIAVLSAVSVACLHFLFNMNTENVLFRTLAIIACTSSLLALGAFTFKGMADIEDNAYLSSKKYDYYKVNISKVTESSDHSEFEVSGTSKAPNGSKVFCSVKDKDDDNYGTNIASGMNDDWAKVKNGKFSFYLDPSDADFSDSSAPGSKSKIIVIAINHLHKDSDDFDLSSKKINANYNKFSPLTLTVSKPMIKQIKESEKDDDSDDNSDDDSNNDSTTDLDSSDYTDDMKDDISDKVSDDGAIDLKKVKVQGQFDLKPATMAISIYSKDFDEDPDSDYQYIVDAIKVIKKYSPSKFDNIKISLWGLVGTPYSTEYESIQSYDIPGKNFKGLKPNNLDKDALESISTDHQYAHFSN